ncbi:MAG: hypothetical protein R3B70_12325 [Polyangiaceae bacterium]
MSGLVIPPVRIRSELGDLVQRVAGAPEARLGEHIHAPRDAEICQQRLDDGLHDEPVERLILRDDQQLHSALSIQPVDTR